MLKQKVPPKLKISFRNWFYSNHRCCNIDRYWSLFPLPA